MGFPSRESKEVGEHVPARVFPGMGMTCRVSVLASSLMVLAGVVEHFFGEWRDLLSQSYEM